METIVLVMIVIVFGIAIYPRKDTFIEQVIIKFNNFELEVKAKEKNDVPPKKHRSHKK